MGSSSGRWGWRTSSEKRPRRSAVAQPARPLGPDPLLVACSMFAVRGVRMPDNLRIICPNQVLYDVITSTI